MGQVLFGGQRCLDPVLLADSLRAQQEAGQAVDLSWVGRANGYRCPLGMEAGSGLLLLSRASLSTLSQNAAQALTFSLASQEILGVTSLAQSVALQDILLVRAASVAPGMRGDANEPMACEITDLRWTARASVINKAYNLRANPGAAPTCYLSATLNGGAAWTWAQMASDIWSAVGKLGTFPGLPFTPDGTPEGFDFYGDSAYRALGVVLERLGCALQFKPLTGTFGVVQVGATDAQMAAALATLDGQRVWDDAWVEAGRPKSPQKLRTCFPIQRTNTDTTGASPYYPIDNTDPSGALSGTESGTYATVYDDLAATYDATNTLTNLAALTSRAAQRAADYFRRARLALLRIAFIGAQGQAGLTPGAQVAAETWYDRGAGCVADVERRPMMEDAWPFSGLPGKPARLTRRLFSDGTVKMRPTGPGADDALVLGFDPSGGGGGGCTLTAEDQNGNIITGWANILFAGQTINAGPSGPCGPQVIVQPPGNSPIPPAPAPPGSPGGPSVPPLPGDPLLWLTGCDTLWVWDVDCACWLGFVATKFVCTGSGSGSNACLTFDCANCPNGASKEFRFTYFGALASSCTDPAAINKTFLLQYAGNCVWTSATFKICTGNVTAHWQLTVGPGFQTVLLLDSNGNTLAQYSSKNPASGAPWNCDSQRSLALQGPGVSYYVWAETVTLEPVCGQSGGGGGGTIATSCCPNTLLCTKLDFTITNVSGCACLNGVSGSMIWDNISAWTSAANFSVPCAGQSMNLSLTCAGLVGQPWLLTGNCGVAGGTLYALSATLEAGSTCSPFSQVWDCSLAMGNTCCSGTFKITITMRSPCP